MRRWLVTGACGQLGAHVLAEILRRKGPDDLIFHVGQKSDFCRHTGLMADLRSSAFIDALLRKVRPTHIMHFAAISSPALAESDATSAYKLHVSATEAFATYA